MNTSTNSTRLLDDPKWLHARGNPDDGLREDAAAMIAGHTDDPDHYSDGSSVFEWFEEFPGHYFATKGALHLPPHRRTAERSRHTYGYGVTGAAK